MPQRTDNNHAVGSTLSIPDDCLLCIKTPETLSPAGARARHAHYLALAEQKGVPALEAHLTTYLHRWLPNDPERARETIRSVLSWVYEQISTYSGMADATTGALLSWAEGRRQGIQAMHAAYDKIAQRAEEERQQRAQGLAVGTALTQAAKAEQSPWASGHIELFFAIQHLPPEEQDRRAAEVCRLHATRYPQDREDWLAEAAWYEAGAPLHAPPLFRSMTPGRAVPTMGADGMADQKRRAANDNAPPF